jgi:tripartite-type tricarboxylate transporter receptor subunit TctC
MTTPSRTLLLATLGAAVTSGILTVPAQAQAQSSYPNRPVRVVVPFVPGGSTDIIGRTVAQKLSEAWGQSVLVDNRGGGATIMGTEIVAKAPPDGYTLLIASASFTTKMSLVDKLPYDTQADFTPITLINTTPLVLVVSPNSPAKTVKDLIALAKAKPGQLNYGSSGMGGSNHLSGELFAAMAGIQASHVPYKGNAPALTDLMGGRVDFIFNGATAVMPLVKAGKLRALGVTSRERAGAAPDLPTMDESGLKGYSAVAFNGIVAPARTPRDIIARINADAVKGIHSADTRERLKADGSDPVGSTPEQFAAFLKEEMGKWAKIIKDNGIRGE